MRCTDEVQLATGRKDRVQVGLRSAVGAGVQFALFDHREVPLLYLLCPNSEVSLARGLKKSGGV